MWTVGQDGGVHGARIALRRAAIDDLVRIATTSWPNVAVRGSAATHLASAPHEAAPALSRLYTALIAPIAPWLPSAPGAAPDDRPARVALSVVVRGAHRPARALSDRALLSRLRAGRRRAGRRADATCRPPLCRGRASRRGSAARGQPGWHRAAAAGRRTGRGAARRADAVGRGHRRHVLVGETATEQAVRAAAPRARVIHFAAHAFADEGGDRDPFIALASSRGVHGAHAVDGRLTASEIYALPLTADLVVLSACRSASGKISSDGIADLAGFHRRRRAERRRVALGGGRCDDRDSDEGVLSRLRCRRAQGPRSP